MNIFKPIYKYKKIFTLFNLLVCLLLTVGCTSIEEYKTFKNEKMPNPWTDCKDDLSLVRKKLQNLVFRLFCQTTV